MNNCSPETSVPELLSAATAGDAAAREQLWTLVHNELRAVARNQLAAEPLRHRRQPTSLIQDVYLRLTVGQTVPLASREQFFAAAAKAMRRIRVDDARTRKRLKRGGGQPARSLDGDGAVGGEGEHDRIDDGHAGGDAGGRRATGRASGRAGFELAATDPDPAELLAVDEVLDRLEAHDPRKARIVMLRFFGDLTIDETADAMGLSPRTIREEWRFARAWLRAELSKGDTKG